MNVIDRIRDWARADDEKVALDRRAFLKGMAVTSGGLLVAGTAIFDMGRRRDRHIVEPDYSGLEQRMAAEAAYGEIVVSGTSGLSVGDVLSVSGGASADYGYYEITSIRGSHLVVAQTKTPHVRTVRR